MNNSVNEKQISSAVIYKLMLIGLSIPMMFLSVIFGVMGMFGYGTVLINGEMITGIAALPASLLFGLIFIAIFTIIFGTMIFIGLWCYSKFRPLKIKTID
ncbi:TPA: hypothetical protein RG697_003193 [Morganella morganii]|nr:hypothetical protein [Morganella morganii]